MSSDCWVLSNWLHAYSSPFSDWLTDPLHLSSYVVLLSLIMADSFLFSTVLWLTSANSIWYCSSDCPFVDLPYIWKGEHLMAIPQPHTHTHTHTSTYVHLHRVKSVYHQQSSSTLCRAISTDIPDPHSSPLPIVHEFQQVFRPTSRIGIELLYVGSSCLCSAIWRGT